MDQQIKLLNPKEALDIVNQALQTVAATPAVHTQIQIAFTTLIRVVEEHERANEEQSDNE